MLMIMGLVNSLKSGTVKILGIVAGVAFALFIAYRKGGKAKEQEVKAKTVEKVIEVTTKERKIEKANHDIGADARRKRLLDNASDTK